MRLQVLLRPIDVSGLNMMGIQVGCTVMGNNSELRMYEDRLPKKQQISWTRYKQQVLNMKTLASFMKRILQRHGVAVLVELMQISILSKLSSDVI